MMEIRIWIMSGRVEVTENGEVVLGAKYKQLRDDDIRCFLIGHLAEGLRECYRVETRRISEKIIKREATHES